MRRAAMICAGALLCFLPKAAHAKENCLSTTTERQNVALIQRLYKSLQRHDYSHFEEMIASDFVQYQLSSSVPGPKDPHVGRQGLLQAFKMLDRSFPDLFTKPEDIIAHGNKVIVRSINTGIQAGPFLGVPGSGKQVRFASIDINQICAGKLQATWHLEDWLSVKEQISGNAPAQ